MLPAVSEKVKILVIDDNPDMLEIYRAMFEGEANYEIDLLSDAMKGLRQLDAKPYDLVILDIVMEPLTGESFFVYLRGNLKTMRLPVIVVSVLEPHTLEMITKLNHSIILQKPIRKEDLFRAIGQCLEMNAAGAKA
jgi:DNA-binding response OmpR family regulator